MRMLILFPMLAFKFISINTVDCFALLLAASRGGVQSSHHLLTHPLALFDFDLATCSALTSAPRSQPLSASDPSASLSATSIHFNCSPSPSISFSLIFAPAH